MLSRRKAGGVGTCGQALAPVAGGAYDTGEPRYLRVLGARKGLLHVAPIQTNDFIPRQIVIKDLFGALS